MRILVIGMIVVGLSGCIGPNPKLGVMDVSRLQPDVATAANGVAVIDTIGAGKTIGPVEATSCKNKLWDADPTQENALAQLKVKAVGVGANAISGVTYEKGGTSFVTNCWSVIVARGTAVVL